jgi:hypothetical protein
VAWYRFVVGWRSRRGQYLVIVVLIALLGGIALGAVATARQTASSYSTYLTSTNPSDLTIEPAGGFTAPPTHLAEQLRLLPHVRHVEGYAAFPASIVRHGRPINLNNKVLFVGSIDGLLFNQDRLTVTSGRMADPRRANEVMVTQTAADALNLHLGDRFVVTIRPSSANAPRSFPERVVGIGVLNREVVQDEVARYPSYIVATPALTRSILPDAGFLYYGVQLQGGSRFIPEIERRYDATEPYFADFVVSSQLAAAAAQSIRPEALALGVFGGIAGLAALVLSMQALVRLLDARSDDLEVMRAIGAGPTTTTVDGLLGAAGASVLGASLAIGIAIVLSPLSPIGPVRPVYPDTGLHPDWITLGLGALALVMILITLTTVASSLRAPHRVARRSAVSPRQSSATRWTTRAGLPVPAVVGTELAFDRGARRNAVPIWWAVLGASIAILLVVTTLTFGSSLQTLVSHPALYGWNWDYAVQSSDGYGPIPNRATASLASDPRVTAWSGVWFATFLLDGVEVPTLLANPGAPVSPPIIAGHGLDRSNQVVLGAATLAELHKHVGDTIGLDGGPSPNELHIVGIATLPAIGIAEGLHTSMSVGAIIPADNGILTEQTGPQGYPGCNGPNMVLLRTSDGLGAAGLAAASSLAAAANTALTDGPQTPTCVGNNASVLAVQRPAQIVNYRSIGATPTLLAAGLALGAVIALALTLEASVRRRQRDLALLKTLGCTQRQLAATVAWQAGAVAAIGLVIGTPLGIALGRWLWDLFARQIGAVPAPSVPAWSLVLSAVGAIVAACLVAAIPGRRAAKTSTAELLREE